MLNYIVSDVVQCRQFDFLLSGRRQYMGAGGPFLLLNCKLTQVPCKDVHETKSSLGKAG